MQRKLGIKIKAAFTLSDIDQNQNYKKKKKGVIEYDVPYVEKGGSKGVSFFSLATKYSY